MKRLSLLFVLSCFFSINFVSSEDDKRTFVLVPPDAPNASNSSGASISIKPVYPHVSSEHNYSDKELDFLTKCDLYEDRYGQVIQKSPVSVIETFCDLNRGHLGFINDWSTPEESLVTLENLERLIHKIHSFRKYSVKPLERVFGKGYVNNLITSSKEILRQEIIERDTRERIARKENWISSQLEHERKIFQEPENRSERLQNLEEIINSISNMNLNGINRELKDIALKQIEICRNELTVGSKERFVIHEKRINALIHAINNGFTTKNRFYGEQLGKIYSDDIQDTIYQEAASLFLENSNLKTAFSDVNSISNISYMINEAYDCAIKTSKLNGNNKINGYAASFNYLDFASSMLSAAKDIAKSVMYLGSRAVIGLGAGFGPADLMSCMHCQCSDAKSYCPSCSPGNYSFEKFFQIRSQEINRKTTEFFDSAILFFAHAKQNPLKFAGDLVEYSSRALANVAFWGAAYLYIFQPIATCAVAAGSVIASMAEEIFSPGVMQTISGNTYVAAQTQSLSSAVESATVIAGAAAQEAGPVAENLAACSVQGGVDVSKVGNKVACGENGLWFNPEKMNKQFSKRGWSQANIDDIIKNYSRRFKTVIERWDNVDGKRVRIKEGEGTVFFNGYNEYVIINERTNEIIQISDKFKLAWIPNWDLWKEF